MELGFDHNYHNDSGLYPITQILTLEALNGSQRTLNGIRHPLELEPTRRRQDRDLSGEAQLRSPARI